MLAGISVVMRDSDSLSILAPINAIAASISAWGDSNSVLCIRSLFVSGGRFMSSVTNAT